MDPILSLMRKAILPIAVLSGLAIALYMALSGSGANGEPLSAGVQRETIERDSELDAPEASSRRTDRVAGTAVETTEPVVSAPDAPTCVVVGRLIDDRDAPIAGARVLLYRHRPWGDPARVVHHPVRGDAYGFEMMTDAGGRFRFQAPPSPGDVAVLEVRPDPHLSKHRVSFLDDHGDYPCLAEGTVDLGDIRLFAAGAVSGRVLDEYGRPIPGAFVETASRAHLAAVSESRSDADGAFVIGHVVPGVYLVRAAADEHRNASVAGVEVRVGETTSGVELRLSLSPTLSGRIVDPNGSPVAGAAVSARPTGGGTVRRVTTGTGGDFELHLPQLGAHRIRVEHDDYVTYEDDELRYEPGTADIEITLEPSVRTRFEVVDAKTGAPVERFGLRIEEGKGALAEGPRRGTIFGKPRVAHYPGGIAEVSARPGFDRFVLVGSGYLPAGGEIEHESIEAPRQVVRLERGASITGRVVRDGLPVAGADVMLEWGHLTRPTRQIFEGRTPDPEPPLRFYAMDSSTQRASTGEDGRFRFDGLPDHGLHRLDIVDDAGHALRVEPFELLGNEVYECGDLELLDGASIAGRVLAPEGCDAEGLTVRVGEDQRRVVAVTDTAGRFRFDGLIAGEHEIEVRPIPGRLASAPDEWVRVSAGEVTDVVLDRREFGECSVTLRVDARSLEAESWSVSLRPIGDRHTFLRLGPPDEDGVVWGTVRAAGDALVAVHAAGIGTVTLDDVVFTLRPGREVSADVEVRVGSVRIELGALAHPTPNGDWKIRVQSESGVILYSGTRSVRDGAWSPASADAANDVILLPLLSAGSRDLELEFEATESTVDPDTGIRAILSRRTAFRATRRVEVVSGQESVVRL